MFIKDSFIDLLNELSGAQESIEKVSVWIQQYRDQAPVIAQAWKNFYLEASQEKKLTLLFLVNDVLQHSKRKGTQFVDAFGHILPKCMSECKNADSKSQIERMLDIWESREVFHKHIISAMKYNLDEIGMDESHVKLTDLMDSLDLLRAHEKKSSDVLTKLSHRLDTTDFANAFNVTSRKEGDKYAADFDETAHFLEQYCSCLLKQTEARSSMIQKINTTMFQMEKTEETIKTQDKEYKNQQGTLVRTRKAVTSRLMLIDEGKVNFGDESPDREEIENLTSEEEDVDIEGIETVEYQKPERLDSDGVIFAKFISCCINIEYNPVFLSILEQYNICKECHPVEWLCIVYLSFKVLLCAFRRKRKLRHCHDAEGPPKKRSSSLLQKIGSSLEVGMVANSLSVGHQVYMMNGKYGPSLPGANFNPSGSQNYGPRLPNNMNTRVAGPPLPQHPAQKFGPSLPTGLPSMPEKLGPPLPNSQAIFGPAIPVPMSTHGPALPATLNSLVNNPDKFGPPIPMQTYPSFGPVLPPAPVFSSFPGGPPPPLNTIAPLPTSDLKFGPPPPEPVPLNEDKGTSQSQGDNSGLPPVPDNCHTTIERLLKLYDTDREYFEGKSNLQDVFGGTARGFDPLEDEPVEPKIISQSLQMSPKKEIPPEDPPPASSPAVNPVGNVLEPILKAYIGSFEPPKFSSFPSDVVNAVIKGKPDNPDFKSDQISHPDKTGPHPEKMAHSPRHRRNSSPHRDHRPRSPPKHGHRSPARPGQRSPPRSGQRSPHRHAQKSPPRHGRRSPPRHGHGQRSPPRQRTPPRPRSPPRQSSPPRHRVSPHRDRQRSPPRHRSPRREKSPHHRRSPHRDRDRRRSPHRRHSPSRSEKSYERSKSDSGRKSDRDRPPDLLSPMFPPGGPLPMGSPIGHPMMSPMGPPLPNQNVIPPNNMQHNRFGPPMPPNNMPPNNMPPNNKPPNNAGPNNMGQNNMRPNNMGPNNMPPNNMPHNNMRPNNQPSNNMGPNNMPPNRFGPPMPQNNPQPGRFGPPMPPNNMQQNRFGPPVPRNNMNMGNMQRPSNFGSFQPQGNNFNPSMNQNFPQGPRMGGPGPGNNNNNMMQRGPPGQFNRGFPPQQRMMQPGPGPFRPRGM